jgi:hypothetical protein
MTPENKSKYQQMIKETLMVIISQKVLYGDESIDTVFSDLKGDKFTFRQRMDAALQGDELGRLCERLDDAPNMFCHG